MNDKSIKLGFGITVIWLAVIGLFCFYGNLESPKSLNELGDALAGIFAPVAFLWLVLGYVQQGKQLEQNTKALEQQERALRLQIDEVRESVKQQIEMNEIQRQMLKVTNNSIAPLITFELDNNLDKYLTVADQVKAFELNKIVLELICENVGKGDAINVQVYSENNEIIGRLTKNKVGEEVRIDLKVDNLLNYERVADISLNQELQAKISISFECVNGNLHKVEKTIILSKIKSQNKTTFAIWME